jgi:DNA polymerase-3 subunit epsilon
VPAEAEAIHGLSTAFLLDKPLFAAVAEEFLAFVAEDMLVIHNAAFDVSFLNAELERLGRAPIAMARVVDTLQLARRKHPAGPNNLDSLCKRYGIDNSKRIKHGALMDSLLLAEVYVELLGERQAAFELAKGPVRQLGAGEHLPSQQLNGRPSPLPSRISYAMELAHRVFVESLGPKAIWRRSLPPTEGS